MIDFKLLKTRFLEKVRKIFRLDGESCGDTWVIQDLTKSINC